MASDQALITQRAQYCARISSVLKTKSNLNFFIRYYLKWLSVVVWSLSFLETYFGAEMVKSRWHLVR